MIPVDRRRLAYLVSVAELILLGNDDIIIDR